MNVATRSFGIISFFEMNEKLDSVKKLEDQLEKCESVLKIYTEKNKGNDWCPVSGYGKAARKYFKEKEESET